MAKPSIESVHKELQELRDEVQYLKSIMPEDAKRLADIRKDPSIGKSEEDLDTYLKQRGVHD